MCHDDTNPLGLSSHGRTLMCLEVAIWRQFNSRPFKLNLNSSLTQPYADMTQAIIDSIYRF